MEKKRENRKPKIGDKVWLRIPHHRTIDFVYKNGDVRVLLLPIPDGAAMSRFEKGEFEIIDNEK